jgi:Signal transduction histidine kinase
MNKKKHSRFNLTLFFTSVVFIIILMTIITVLICSNFLLNSGIFERNRIFIQYEGHKPQVLYFIIYLIFLSLIAGASISIILGKISFKPFRDLIDAMNELSKGNFDARLVTKWKYTPYELNEVSENFNKMAKALNNIEVLGSDFINTFSHEFKTPIVSLRGFAKILKDGDLTESERNDYLDIIISESERLSTLATNVLNLSHIENKTIALNNQKYNLTEQIRKAILLLENKWNSKNLELSINLDEVIINADEIMLNQMWINLIDNAIKYSNLNGKIQIDLMKFSDNTIFKISDYGIGMNEEEKRRMFDKFYQADISRATKGNGIGLTIVKKIIDIYHGNIHVTSQPGFGTIITVTLPLGIN